MSEAWENEIVRPDGCEMSEESRPPCPAVGDPSLEQPEWTGEPPVGTVELVPGNVETPHTAPSGADVPLFDYWSRPAVVAQPRIPHLGHLALLAALTVLGLLVTSLLTRAALRLHWFGVTTVKDAVNDIHYTLGSMASLYLLTLLASALIFPLFWHRGLFDGLQWRGTLAVRLRGRLFIAAFVCFLLALVNGWLLPGPADAPIDKMFRTPGAAWLMFAFGVTLAPFFEELAFRGFLLPATCTALDWIGEKVHNESPPPLDGNGHPQWSILSMIAASVLVSVPFALMHAEQTGYSIGPFLLLVCVSLVLCWVRLSLRSLAASVIVHACYNFLLFSLMLLGTAGFRHLERM